MRPDSPHLRDLPERGLQAGRGQGLRALRPEGFRELRGAEEIVARGARSFAAAGFLAAIVSSLPGTAWPHGAGDRYDLPAPLVYFVAGAALTVGLSFAVMAMATRGSMRANPNWAVVVPLGSLLRWLRPACGVLSVALLGLVLAAGLFGDPHPMKNLAPTFVWIAWWVGLSLVVACIGNVWPAVDPWRAVFDTVDALARRATRGRGIARGWTYPRALGVWPAAILLLGFA